MLGTSWECHKVREFALRPMGDFLLVLDLSCQFHQSHNERCIKVSFHMTQSMIDKTHHLESDFGTSRH